MEDYLKFGIFKFDGYRLNPLKRLLSRGGDVVPLGSRAFDILVSLVRRRGEIVSRDELMAFAWAGLNVTESNVRVQMTHLRKELGCGEDGQRYIVSVASRGYSFVAPVEFEGPEESQLHEEAHAFDSTVVGLSDPGPHGATVALGRENDIAEVVRMVCERRLVSLIGGGGVGKSLLASLVATTSRSFETACFVDLASIADGSDVFKLVERALLGGAGAAAAAVDDPNSPCTLLIIDNCEHVIDDVAGIAKSLLAKFRNIHILVTSREALRISGEAVYLLRSLDLAPSIDVLTAEEALCSPAVQLFVERALDGGHLTTFGDEHAAPVAMICKQLDGNPLAIELVASKLGPYSLEHLSELLDSELSLRWRGRRGATPHHHTLEAMLDRSFSLLSEVDQRVFMSLSRIQEEFSVTHAVEAVENTSLQRSEIEDSIGNLIDKSMISAHPVSRSVMLRMSAFARTYAAAKLTGRKSDEAIGKSSRPARARDSRQLKVVAR